jgi:signal transduction histidine kinase
LVSSWNFSRLDEADKKPVNLHEGIDSTLLILQNRWKATSLRSGIQIIKEYGDLPEVECYAGKLNQVFMNIISNAIDALEEGVNNSVPLIASSGTEEGFIGKGQLPSPITPDLSPVIRIRTTILDSNLVEIRITDNGSGMTEEVQSKIFDPFFTTKPVGQGTGLGLSISYQIVVEKHGGQLQCISAPGKGAEFVITIPQRQTSAPRQK